MGTRLGAKVIGIEETGLAEFIKQPIKNEMSAEALSSNCWLKARGGSAGDKGKPMRIRELVPYYRGGYIYHNASCVTLRKLEQQLLCFPGQLSGTSWTVKPYIVEMLELGERYFLQPTTLMI